ncbi:hypothetical protein ENSA5_09970 [Enhygromyxa salina]|uniref:Secreted protein n=1 Tax=Enhygromyxa salina TaxID=215803 RepID=A0A2S9YGH3_9BACT|nr:hypothetical protein [Enhygromyxa salina]PRQ04213.1 hypothetical protein ENSA5_09970 [Enhygromyxa salina]
MSGPATPLNKRLVRVLASLALALCAALSSPRSARAQSPAEAPTFATNTEPGSLADPNGQGGGTNQSVDPNRLVAEHFAKIATRLGIICADPEQPFTLLTSTEDIAAPVVPAAADDWKGLCATYCGDAAKIDLCAFSDPALARVAATNAQDDIRTTLSALEPIRKYADQLQPLLQPLRDSTPKLTPIGQAVTQLSTSVNTIRQSADAGAVGALLSGGATGMDVLEPFLGGLARVIADRAKREAIGWMLDEIGDRVCGAGPLTKAERKDLSAALGQGAEAYSDIELVTLAEQLLRERPGGPNADALRAVFESPHMVLQTELRNELLPNLCALARENRLDHYGAGAALLEALRGALEADIEGWPGVVTGVALAEFHWSQVEGPGDASAPQQPALVACKAPSAAQTEGCAEVGRLRRAGQRFIERLLDHADPLIALRELGAAASRASVRASEAAVVDPPLALLACGVSLPAEIAHFEPRFHNAAKASYTAVLTSMLDAPACWVLVGQGYASVEASGDLGTALANPDIERLSTIVRLHRHAGQQLQSLAIEVNAMQTAATALASTSKADAAPDHARDHIVEQWQAGIAVIDASLSLTAAILDAAEGLSDPTQMFPGLDLAPELDSAGAATALALLERHVEATHAISDKLRAGADVASKIAIGDYAQAVAVGSAELLSTFSQVCGTHPATSECRARLDALGRSSGTIAALLSAETTEQMAETIDAAANPPGGWRRKLVKDNVTISLASYPGIFAATEFRWGPYGATLEQGRPAYGQAPTLSLPVGIDIVRGFGNWGFGGFLSILDPAAFLHYDVSNSGQLPGPRPVTVLAPGAFLRFNLGPTPLVALLGAVYRPQFRTWGPTVSGPGADALQIGVALGVDLTLWRLYARGK